MKNSVAKVRLTRTVSFSSGHRYWLESRSSSENKSLFGKFASPYNHGHNYLLEVTVEGAVNPSDGMVVNIKDIDALLKVHVTGAFDGKSLNDEVPPFKNTAPSTENLALCIWNLVAGKPVRLRSLYTKNWRWDADLLQGAGLSCSLPEQCELVKIRLQEMPGLFVEIESLPERNFMTLTHTYEFAASHRLHVPEMTEEENVSLFGKCNNRAGHGHNYVLEVTVEGEPDGVTGMLVDLEELDKRVHSRVVDRYDHRNLNEDIPELKSLNPTSEVVALKIFELLDGQIPGTLYRVRLHETARNCFEVVRG